MKIRSKFLAALATLLAISAPAAQAQVVISQVYGGGNNGGATFQNDFIELFNAGASAQSLNGLSVQYASSAGSTWNNLTVLSNVTLQPGQYYLIQESGGTTNGAPLPTADQVATTPINMSGTNGKVALVNGTTSISTGTNCPTGATILDFVGFGSANCTNPTGVLSNTTAAIRKTAGCTNTGNNTADFDVATPTPRNGATALNVCASAGHSNPSGAGTATPNSGMVASTTLLTVAVTPGVNPPSTGIAVVVDLSPIGGSATQTFLDDGNNGDATAGDNVYSYTATIGSVASGNKSLIATITDNEGGSSTAPISFAVTSPPLTIMQIQGHGTASAYNGQIVTTNGTVVTAKKSNGFFMQDPIGDGDLTTSDAIFVFTSSAPAVQVGDQVNVTGTVQEFSGSTEMSGTPTVTVTASPAPVQPTAYVLDSSPPTNDPTTGICMGGASTITNPPPASDGYQASNFACLDNMLVTVNDATVNGATFGNGASDGVHTGTASGTYVMVTNGSRAFHGPGAAWPGIAGQPDIPVFNGEPEVFELFYGGLGFSPAGHLYNAGARITVTGVIQGFKPSGATAPIYEMYPFSISDVAPAPSYPQAVAPSAAGTLTIGSQNLLHFFNNTADVGDTSGYTDTCAGTGASDTCPTLAEYQARVSKWTRQICDVLHAPVVMDIEEIENIAVARDLATGIASYCGVTYQPYVIPGNDVSGINIGILVRNDVVVSSVTQMYKSTQTANCSSGGGPCLLNDRPPVLMRASWNGYPFALLAMYDRSLSGITVTDPAKLYVGAKRAEQAAQIASIEQAFQSGATLTGAGNAQQDATGTVTNGSFDIVGDANVPLIVAGDFNAYEFTDGIADVTGMITGNAVQAQNFFWYSGNAFDPTPAYVAPSPTLVDSGVRAAPGERYSFSFDGLSQEIDHIVLSRRAWKDFVSIGNAHGNSDVSEADPVILDGSTAARAGDHDGQVVTLAIDRIFADGYEAQP